MFQMKRASAIAALVAGWAAAAAALAAQGAGPNDKPTVDAAAADRGRKTYAAECINCHGTQTRGTSSGSNLIRSLVVLRDRYGSELGPFLKKGHSLQSGKPSAELTEAQVKDLAHFIRQRINDTLRGSPIFQPQNVLTGDAKAGAAYFAGEGKCATCHSTAGNNLAGIGAKYQPVDLQQRFLFPGGGRGGGRGRGSTPTPNPNAIRVTVTPPSGAAISGVLVQMDDFLVSLRDADGTLRTIRRVPGMTVVKSNPLQFHIDMLDRLTDKNMHDVVAYLESLK
jgi:mono/diheme cytochrome c family protein